MLFVSLMTRILVNGAATRMHLTRRTLDRWRPPWKGVLYPALEPSPPPVDRGVRT